MKLSLESTMSVVEARRPLSTGSALNAILNEAPGTVWRNHLNWKTAHREIKRADCTDYFGAEQKAPGR